MVSILVPSSTLPNQHPFFWPPPASSPRAPSCRGYGCRSRRSQPLSPMPGATKVELPPPPLSSHALGFENRGRKRCPGKAQRARACGHGDAERRGDALFLSREQMKAREFFLGPAPHYGPCYPVVHPAQKKKITSPNTSRKTQFLDQQLVHPFPILFSIFGI